MPESSQEPSLWQESHRFAERLNYLMAGVLPGNLPTFGAEQTRDELVAVSTGQPFSLYRTGEQNHFAYLDVSLHCVWSSQKPILAVTKSVFKLRGPSGGVPVLHVDYQRDMRSDSVPVAHYNVSSQHPALRAMADPDGVAEGENQEAEVTRKLHLPTGGHRFRPTLEDLLAMLITDLNVEPKQGWEYFTEEGRGLFREMQTAAAVRDHPDKAVEELRRLGYAVKWLGDPTTAPDRQIRADRFYRY